MNRRVLPLLLCALLVIPGAAFAKKGKKKKNEGIMEVGIETLDRFFSDVREIDRRLTNAQNLLGSARKDLNTALGIKRNAKLSDAIGELRARADGKVALAMNGKVPQLKPTDAVPTDVKSGVDAVNRLSSNMATAIEELAGVPKRTQELVKKSKTLPADLKKELSGGDLISKISTGPKAFKALNHNIGVTKSLPGKADRVVTRMNSIQSTVRTEFAPGSRAPRARR